MVIVKNCRTQISILLFGLVFAPHIASAADNPTEASTSIIPGEIVVTAQKREQNAQRVGIAITALGKETLAAIGRQDVTALEAHIPSLAINQFSPTVTVFNIRGVSQNDFTDAQEAPIAFYDDEVYISSLGAITGMNFDLERVEVLRGPQGTLFGRNATGGLVQFVSAKPTAKTEGFLTLTTGSYGQVATEGALSGALSDHIRARLSFTSNNEGGYITNLLGPSIGNAKFYAFRAQISADLSRNDKLNFKVQMLRNDHERNGSLYAWVASYPDPNNHLLGNFAANVAGGNPGKPYTGAAQGQDANGYENTSGNPFVQSVGLTPYFNRTYWDMSARYDHDSGAVQITSISDYQHMTKQYGEDTDMSPLDVFEYSTSQNFYQASEELRISGKTPTLNWLVGVYLLNIHSSNQYTVNSPTDDYPGLGLLNYGGSLNTNSVATFGQLEYEITPNVTAIGGLRWSHDRKHDEYQDYANGALMFDWATSLPDVAGLRFATFNNWSGKAEFDYKPNAATLIYASVNRGTKSGGFGTVSANTPYTDNAAVSVATGQPLVQAIPFGQEVLTNWEGGFKLTLLNHTTHFNGSFFYYNYQGYQAFQNIGINQYISNHQAYEHGAEFEFNTRPFRGIDVGTFATLLSTKVKNVVLPDGTLADRQMPQASKSTMGWQVHYSFAYGPGQIAVGTDWKHESSEYFETDNAPIDLQRAHTVGNARISYVLDSGKYEFAAFLNNVSDKHYLVYSLDLSGLLGSSTQTYARPRTWGASFTAKY